MKKVIAIFLGLLVSTFLYAGKWSFNSAAILQLSPKTAPKAVSNEGENHFAPITGMNIPIPFGQVSARYRIPLDFGENPLFKGASFSIGLTPIITPISFDNRVTFTFTPTPLLNLSFGASAGTAWELLDYSGMGKYNPKTGAYDSLDPFKDWKYSFSCSASMSFDFGILFPGEWTHIITSASYSTSYDACTAAENCEPWSMTGSETVNGFSYSASATLGYMMPFKFKMISCSANFNGRYSGEDYGVYNKNYDGDFVSISLSLQGMVSLAPKSSLQIVASLPSRRAFVEETKTGDVTINKTTAGREWVFSGITFMWAYSW